jgi:hypothetical protein
MNGYGMEASPVKRLVRYAAPAAVGAFAVDQAYRLVPRFMPMDLSKRTSRVLLGLALSLGAGLAGGALFAGDRELHTEVMALAFAGGVGSVIMRETMEAL